MIRPTVPSDKESILKIACATGLFEPGQTEFLDQLLDQHTGARPNNCPFWLTDEIEGPIGAAYCEPERLTEGTWNLQLIVVHPSYQGKGRGAGLICHLETHLASQGARLLLVETSGVPEFQLTWNFYRKCGFEEVARIRDFYSEGVDKIVFWKKILRS